MTHLSIFDIAGPIMVGPSSSHTAGACKIGQFARALFHSTPKKVTFYLHGSFGEVYKGHATDKALLAGVMKFMTSDPRIKDSFEIAKEKEIKYEFITRDLGHAYHPNTVKIVLERGKYRMSVIGSSIGG
ncbi:MAG: L-serine ammonia-lyase, iron-sulfur-dependent subunit beta, partial [Patescibacteria group bacterium]